LPNVTIGAHTHTHRVLSCLIDKEAFEEIRLSKEILEACVGKQLKHFAFPFGGINEVSKRDFRLVSELGFDSAATTLIGALDVSQTDQYALPRCFYSPGLTLKSLQVQILESSVIKIIKRLIKRD